MISTAMQINEAPSELRKSNYATKAAGNDSSMWQELLAAGQTAVTHEAGHVEVMVSPVHGQRDRQTDRQTEKRQTNLFVADQLQEAIEKLVVEIGRLSDKEELLWPQACSGERIELK